MDSGCFFRVMAINLLLGILSLRNLRENAIETANYKTYNYVIKHHRNWPKTVCLVTKFFLVHILATSNEKRR